MKQWLTALLFTVGSIVFLVAQDFSEQTLQFEIQPQTGRSFVSKPISHSLKKTTPFIAASAIVKGAALDETVRLLVWAAPDGSTKKRWIELEHDHHFEGNGSELHFPPVFLNGNTQKFRYKLISKEKRSSAVSVSINLFVPANVYPQVAQLSSEDSSGARACSCPQPTSVGRSSWGSSYGLTANASCSNVSYTTVTHLIVHHAAGTNSSTNWAGVVASYWNYHVNSNGWCDIGYNWLIDPNGVLYVGRGGGNNVVGAHMCGYNQNTMGVCMLGNYNTATPSTAAMNKLTELLAWKCCNANINPLGSGSIASYPGTMNNISGHKDGCAPSYTDCPGTNLYNQISNLRNAVNNFINAGCSFGSQPTAPTNDYCSGAIALTSQLTCNYQSFSTAGATGSLPATSPCNGFTGGNADDDVWFSFTATANEHSIHLLNGTGFDGVADVRNGCYASSTSIGCSDEQGSTGVLNTVSLTNLVIGNVYYVRVYHYGTGSGGGNFQICLTHPQPSCNEPSTKSVSNITSNAATLSWSGISGASYYEVWHKQAGAASYTKTTTTSTTFNWAALHCNTNYEWGVITYCANGTNSGAPSSFNAFTTLNNIPSASVQHTASGYDVSFTATTADTALTFRWNFGDGAADVFQQNPQHTYPPTGVPTTYHATLTVINACDSQTIAYPFTLTPDCNFSIAQHIAAVDSNFQSIQVQLSNAENCPWTASANCGFVAVSPASGSGSSLITLAVAANGDTMPRTCAIDIAGQVFTITQSGKVAPANCVFTLAPDSAVVDSSARQIQVQLGNAAACSWSTFVSCGFVQIAPQSGSASGVVVLSVAANNDTLSRTCNILIADKNFVLIQHGKQPPAPPVDPCLPPLPAPPIAVNGCVVASTPAVPNVQYAWYKNGVLIPAVNGRFFTVEDDKGYYYVVITDSNGCTAQSADMFVDCTIPPLGIKEAQALFVSVVPNPASQQVVVAWSETSSPAILQIHDALGRLVFAASTTASSVEVPVHNWASAVYFFSLKHRQTTTNGKFLVRH